MEGAEAHDWEDMASFMLDERPCLLIADVGDNQSRAAGYTLYLVEEPELTTNPTTNRRLALLQTVHFRYSDGPHDCEAMAFDPTDRRAFFRADATEEVYVELPAEARVPGQDLVGLLRKSMYGTRSAAKNWQQQLGRDITGNNPATRCMSLIRIY